jgi:hypothetical protein
MGIEHRFDAGSRDLAGRRAALEVAAARAGGVAPASRPTEALEPADAGEDAIAVPPAFEQVLPRGMRRGEVISVREVDDGIGYTTLALIASALRQGLWSAAVGADGLGGAALAGMLASMSAPAGALQRLLVVPQSAKAWPEVVAVLADGIDLLVMKPPARVPAALGRRVDARIRQNGTERPRHRSAVIVLGPWPSASVRVERIDWVGMAEGTGHLRAGRARLIATDRSRRERVAALWLPAPDGGIATARPDRTLSARADRGEASVGRAA